MASDDDSYVYDTEDEEEYVYEEGEGGAASGAGFVPDAPSLARQSSMNIGTVEEVSAAMQRVVDDTAEVLFIPKEDSLLLLQFFKWDDQKLKGQYFDKDDELDMCPVTLDDDIPWDKCDSLPCGHWMSVVGWTDYMAETAAAGPGMVHGTCFASRCHERLRPRMFKTYLSPEQFDKYNQYVVESYVVANPETQWCPAPGCSFVSQYAGGGARDVACKCGHEYCFACRREAHKPADCDMAKRWEDKNSSESENTTWIMANTKPCPKCGVSIEKNQGCNHMTCRKQMGGCGHDFCWMCLGPWSAHGGSTGGYYTCNKYEKLKEKGQLGELSGASDAARERLDRYIHYFSRYDNHERARRHARQLLVKLNKKMDRLQSEKGLTYKDVECLKSAVEAILKGRRVLKWSYVFAFYCTNAQELALFEFLQQQLETNNEHLLELVELRSDVDKYLDAPSPEVLRIELFDYLREVRNYVSISMKFMEDVLSGVENGLTEPGAGAAAGDGGGDAKRRA